MTNYVYSIHPSGGTTREKETAHPDVQEEYRAYMQGQFRKSLGRSPVFRGRFAKAFQDGYQGVSRPDLARKLAIA